MTPTITRAQATISQRGVTLVELLVVMLILSLLATLATPVFINRVNEARLATARTEVEEIAKAQQLCGLTHGVYVPLQVLDDLPIPEGGGSAPAGTDDIDNSAASTIFLINTNASSTSQDGSQANLSNFSTDALAARIYFGWKGPFLNANRVFNPGTGGLDFDARFDHPLDPWSNPYRFYAPIGPIGTTSESATTPGDYDDVGFSNGDIVDSPGSDRFDRYAIVSFGPDGVPGTPTDSGDDIIYLFGFEPNETTFSF
jgi:prepilin-type N-terminal cleavage/methylation domain-containing protein